MPNAVVWIVIAALAVILLSALALWSFGRFARRARGAPSSALPCADAATALDRLIAPLLSAQAPGASAATVLGDPVGAFLARARAARAAERSLDLQYYIWHHDVTGRLLEGEVATAAERGVRVRLLIDDMNLAGGDDEWMALDAHPNVEIRVFNPARNRAPGIRRALEMGLRFIGFNRRMHNKAWIADNRVAVVGGRNVGDEYFGAAAGANFRDSDLMLLGPAVAETSGIFDRFWNSAAVVPLCALHRRGSRWSPDGHARRRQEWLADARDTAWGNALAERESLNDPLGHQGLLWHWTTAIRVLSDPPEKSAPVASRRNRSGWLLYDVMALLFSARRESWLISPYFVPGNAGALLLAGQVWRGMRVRVLTNSLAANDVPMVHAGYAAWRGRLLTQGVALYELKPGQHTGHKLTGSSGASLHTKAFAVDGERGFVGSFNFDPRSAQLNTEMGVMFDDPDLAAELTRSFDEGIDPKSAWEVHAAPDGGLRWRDAGEHVWMHDPEAGAGLRLLVRILRLLPIESQL